LTMEQDLKMRQIKDALEKPDTRKEDIITLFMALQMQCFILGNNMQQLLKQWNHQRTTETTGMSGTSSDSRV